MDTDEEKVRNFLESKGFTVERFSETEIKTTKTPDFRVIQNGQFQFFCEVKSSHKDRWLDEQFEEAGPGELDDGSRNDPIFNRLAKDIHSAVKQFDAVNKNQEYPNVLALVNHDYMCGFNDLLAVLTGNFYAENGMIHPIYRQFSHGRIREEKRRVHLFIWLDDQKPEQLLFNQTDEKHHSTLLTAFRLSQKDVVQIHSNNILSANSKKHSVAFCFRP